MAPLSYPDNFFLESDGKIARQDHDLQARWCFRKQRPDKDVVDATPFNKEIMLAEMTEMHKQLKDYAKKVVNEQYVLVAKALGLKRSTDGQEIHSLHVLREELCRLQYSEDNHLLVFRILHEWSKDRAWQAQKIDEWAMSINIQIVPVSTQQHPSFRRVYAHSRGGFGRIFSIQRNSCTTSMMNCMERKVFWSIDASNRKHQSKYIARVSKTNTTPVFEIVVFVITNILVLFHSLCKQ
jgi:hypothetical protein